ncbi:hypothetical protein [Tenuifilum osseticum]|uniref:hypothetical protein n=1 Tax=Tenuifilum osseticum TaxID=3374723 RepID=UPI0034E4B716
MINVDEIFDLLISEDDSIVINCLNRLNESVINKPILSYILNLANFHRDSKIRKLAQNLFEKSAPTDLILKVKENWKSSYLKNQEYYRKELFEHSSIDLGEYLVFAQVIRKNYYLVKPKVGMISYAFMRYGDEIENIFDCYQVKIEKLPRKIVKLQHLSVVNFRQQDKLDLEDTIELLSQLKNLRFLQIGQSKLSTLPISLSKLERLEQLIIDVNPINSIDNKIVLPHLKKLDIKSTQIKQLDLSQFPALEELWIDDEKTLNSFHFKNVKKPFIATSGQYFKRTIE